MANVHQSNERLFRCFTRLENSLEDVQPYKGWRDDLNALRDAALSRKVLADALNDLITREQRMKIKGEMKPGKFSAVEVVNYGVRDARDALEQAGIPVRKTGRV